MATLVLNASLSVSPTVGAQPALSQIFTSTVSIGVYAESVVTVPAAVSLLSALVGPVGTSAVRLRNITPTTVSGTALIAVIVGGTVIATLANGQDLLITGAMANPISVQMTGTAVPAQVLLYALSAT